MASTADRKKTAEATMQQLASSDPSRGSAKPLKQSGGGKGSTVGKFSGAAVSSSARAQAQAEAVFKKAIQDGTDAVLGR